MLVKTRAANVGGAITCGESILAKLMCEEPICGESIHSKLMCKETVCGVSCTHS